MAYRCITMIRCIVYIYDPDRILTFDLKVKFIAFMTLLCVWASAFLSFNVIILSLAGKCTTMVQCVAYTHDHCMTLTFDLKNYIFIINFSLARSFCFLIKAYQILAYWCINMRHCCCIAERKWLRHCISTEK